MDYDCKHVIKKGCFYWDVSQYPLGVILRRAKVDFRVELTNGPTKTSHGYLTFFRGANGIQIAADERCVEVTS